MTSAIPRELTLLVPALNEESLIRGTVEQDFLPLARDLLDRVEVILVDDGSSDGTGAEMDALAAAHAEVRVIHHPTNLGLAAAFRRVLSEARLDSFALLPGDGAYSSAALEALFRAVGSADVIVGYRTNQFAMRATHRVLISIVYKRLVSLTIGHDLLDYHGAVVYPTEALRRLDLRGQGYTFQLEAIVKLLDGGATFIQVPLPLAPEEEGSRSLRLGTLRDVYQTLRMLRGERR